MKDAFGQELAVGDKIVYGVRDSCSVWMRKGTIEAIESKPKYTWDDCSEVIEVLKIRAESNDYGEPRQYNKTLRVPRAIVKVS